MTHFNHRQNPHLSPRSEAMFLRMVRRVLVVGIVLVAITAMTGGSGSRTQVRPTEIPADASASWLHSTRANEADRAKGWHPCEHDCSNQSCDKICHFK